MNVVQRYVRQSEVSDADFLEAWEAADTLLEVMDGLGMTKCQVSGRALRMQLRGIPMTPMVRRAQLRRMGYVPVPLSLTERTGIDPEELRQVRDEFLRWRERGRSATK